MAGFIVCTVVIIGIANIVTLIIIDKSSPEDLEKMGVKRGQDEG